MICTHGAQDQNMLVHVLRRSNRENVSNKVTYFRCGVTKRKYLKKEKKYNYLIWVFSNQLKYRIYVLTYRNLLCPLGKNIQNISNTHTQMREFALTHNRVNVMAELNDL